MSYFIVTDEDLIRQQNALHRQFMRSVNAPESYEQRLMREARERHAKAVEEARERIRAKGIDPDSL